MSKSGPTTRKNISGVRAKSGGAEYGIDDVEQVISLAAAKFSKHAFLKRLESTGVIEDIHVMARYVTFYVFAFQDMLRLVREKITDPQLKKLARTHEIEDKGHDKWFVSDLRHFGVTTELSWVFGPAHEVARDVSYEILADILRARDDWSRFAIVLALEGIGAECFDRAIGFLERLGEDRGVKYFARRHQQIEQNHQVFDRHRGSTPLRNSLSKKSFEESRRAVTRTFSSMTRLADYLEQAIALAGRDLSRSTRRVATRRARSAQ